MSDSHLVQLMQEFDDQLSHVWMVRTFLKHSEEAQEDEELQEVYRALYDFALALGPALNQGDAPRYFTLVKKKFSKFRRAVELFAQIQPEVSTHTNFVMAVRSLQTALRRMEQLLHQATQEPTG